MVLIYAFVQGLLHSLEPSHAKAVLASYFLNRKRTVFEAFAFAWVVTVAHTLTIYLLTLAGYLVGSHFHSEQMEQWGERMGGLLMIGIGIWMFWNERSAGFHNKKLCSHDDSHGHFFHHHHYSHDHPAPSSLREIFVLGFCSGAIPCMSGMTVMIVAWGTSSLWSGLLIVAIFSMGLGLVVLVMCLMMQQMASLMDRYWKNNERWNRFLPVLSSIIMFIVGGWIVIHSFSENSH